MTYDLIIGIETHIQLNTQTKMFCACSTDSWQAAPNTLTCPVCLGLPGALPVINKAALDKALLVALALGGQVAEAAHFDRKNYFYPDLAKGYQISQYDQPLQLGGQVMVDGQSIGLIRAHLEEDVGKLNHDGHHSLVDFNKGGTPLLEIVSEPVIHTAAQAKAYVQALRQLARYLGVNDGNLERGVMRADVNISLQTPGQWRYEAGEFVTESGYKMNNRVEVKNLNSFRSIERAVEYEMTRQSALLAAGQSIIQETRGWDESLGQTIGQRGKEEAHDYRYFPEPDLPPLQIDQAWVDQIRLLLPELPLAKQQRFVVDYGLTESDARMLTDEQATADWFEQAVQDYAGDQTSPAQAKSVSNWVMGELSRLQNDSNIQLVDSNILPGQLATVLKLIDEGAITGATAKEIVAETFATGQDPRQLVEDRGLAQVSGTADLEPIAQAIIVANPEVVTKYREGKTSSLQFLVGQVMKETRGQANPAVVTEILTKLLS